MTQEVLATRLGKSRSTIANSRRLLRLAAPLQALLERGALSPGHGRALLSLDAPDAREGLAEQVLEEGLSVRETERLAKRLNRGESKVRRPRKPGPLEPYLEGLAAEIGASLSLDAEVKLRGRQGKLTLHFHGGEQLRELRDLLCQVSEHRP